MDRPKTITEMHKEASNNKSGKFVIIPKTIKKFERNGKTMNLPTDVEISNINK